MSCLELTRQGGSSIAETMEKPVLEVCASCGVEQQQLFPEGGKLAVSLEDVQALRGLK
jgi:hypothetical protein